MTQKNVKIFCAASILVFLILQFFSIQLTNAISYAISAAALLNWAYDCLLWRFNPFEKTPRLYGIYNESFYSTYDHESNHTGKVTIRQTLSSIVILEESEYGYCESVTASLSQGSLHGSWNLYYTYLTHPRRSPSSGQSDDMHYGSCVLVVKSQNLLEGSYYTNRINQTSGSIKLEKLTD